MYTKSEKTQSHFPIFIATILLASLVGWYFLNPADSSTLSHRESIFSVNRNITTDVDFDALFEQTWIPHEDMKILIGSYVYVDMAKGEDYIEDHIGGDFNHHLLDHGDMNGLLQLVQEVHRKVSANDGFFTEEEREVIIDALQHLATSGHAASLEAIYDAIDEELRKGFLALHALELQKVLDMNPTRDSDDKND